MNAIKRFILPYWFFLKNIRDAHRILSASTLELRRERERYYRKAREEHKKGNKLLAASAMGAVSFIDEFAKKHSIYEL